MRPGQNKRMRGRPSNNRRGPNPLTRSYESNGPDVKIRGNAHHVAEKYLQLARDAHTGGDPVAAENYLQHAEHYFRLIAAAQAAQLQAQGGGRPPGEGETYEIEDEDDTGGPSDRFASPPERAPVPYAPPPQPYQPQPGPIASSASQPYAERAPGEGDRQGQADRGAYQGRQDRPSNRHQDRGPRPDRPFSDRQDRPGQPGRDGRPREFRPYREPSLPRETPAPAEAPGAASALPSFITAAPRIVGPQDVGEAEPAPIVENAAEPGEAVESGAPRVEPQADGRFPGRGRRRRLRSPYGFHGGVNADEEGGDAPVIASEAPISE
ncbi:MAG: DUF4167 domain-containing protein [Roseiarcus sp.]